MIMINKCDRCIYWFGLSVIIASMMLIMYVTWLLVYPVPTIDIVEPMLVKNSVVKRGSAQEVFFDYCRYTDANSTVYFQIYSAEKVISTPVYKSRLNIECDKIWQIIKVPELAPIGEVYMKAHVTYHVNRLHDINRTFVTETFIIE